MVFFTPVASPLRSMWPSACSKASAAVCLQPLRGRRRARYAYADERLSIGDYVLTGGELPLWSLPMPSYA
ncbi:MAG: hypothetical protein ACLTYW_01645 [Collinsella sp.]